MKEIMIHIDPWIIQFIKPDVQQSEGLGFLVSRDCGDEWYTPNSPPTRWTQVSCFKPLAAVGDRFVDVFERLKKYPKVMSMAKLRLAKECDSLTSKIEAQRLDSLEMDAPVLGDYTYLGRY